MTARLVGLLAIWLWPPASPEVAAPRVEETRVFEAVLRQQVELILDESARARRTVVCLGINPGDAPQSASRELQARFREPAVRGLSECEPRGSGAVEGATRAPAVLVTAGPIEWVAADEAWVTLTHFRTWRDSGVRTYRVVRERSGWVSLGPIYVDGHHVRVLKQKYLS